VQAATSCVGGYEKRKWALLVGYNRNGRIMTGRAAHVRAEAAISTRNGLTVDLAEFAIASPPMVSGEGYDRTG
jgi:hypothetical protein